ncbi:MAG: replication-associated recombination protein A [Bifidobacteriaceae bacterium]|nr:replication-associated recombination protein A [Bifidobacteriaceae bacterium]
MSFYSDQAQEHLEPLAERMRPRRLEDVMGQEEVTAPGSPLRLMAQRTTSSTIAIPGAALLYGPPGTGKTTLSQLVAQDSGRHLMKLSAVNLHTDDLIATLATISRLRRRHEECILFVDEVHRMPRDQQDILLPVIEKRMMDFIAATTEPPSSCLAPALLSRCVIVHLHKLSYENLEEILDRACVDERGLKGAVRLDPEARKLIIVSSGGDARRALTTLEAAASRAIATVSDGHVSILKPDDVRAVVSDMASYSLEDQNNMASAFIKSMRGSDPDATVYWATRMLDAGEDPRFLARRVVITAAKDVGMADPAALRTAVSAWEAVERLGMPDARTSLLEAAVYVAVAPKSDSIFEAAKAASDDIRINGMRGDVPMYLRTPMDDEQQKEGEGNGYLNPHDYGGFVQQSYMPEGVGRRVYYKPKDAGMEHQLIGWVDSLRKFNDGEAADGGTAAAGTAEVTGAASGTASGTTNGAADDGATGDGTGDGNGGNDSNGNAAPADVQGAAAQNAAGAVNPSDANSDAANADTADSTPTVSNTMNSTMGGSAASVAVDSDFADAPAADSPVANSPADTANSRPVDFASAETPRARHAQPGQVSDHVEEVA